MFNGIGGDVFEDGLAALVVMWLLPRFLYVLQVINISMIAHMTRTAQQSPMIMFVVAEHSEKK